MGALEWAEPDYVSAGEPVMVECEFCRGVGLISGVTCPTCDGVGEVVAEPCWQCDKVLCRCDL